MGVRTIVGLAAIIGVGLVWYPASAKVALSSTVTWVDATSDIGTALFQGSVDGTSLRGVVEADGQRLLVSGSVTSDGEVSGTIAAPAGGGQVGTFVGTLDGSELDGTFTIGTDAAAAWTAPSDPGITSETTPQP